MTTLNTYGNGPVVRTGPAFSIPSVLAIAAAIGSFMVAPGMQFLLAIVAAVLGLIGVIIAILPGKRGGVISFVSIGLGAIALLIAIIRGIASIG